MFGSVNTAEFESGEVNLLQERRWRTLTGPGTTKALGRFNCLRLRSRDYPATRDSPRYLYSISASFVTGEVTIVPNRSITFYKFYVWIGIRLCVVRNCAQFLWIYMLSSGYHKTLLMFSVFSLVVSVEVGREAAVFSSGWVGAAWLAGTSSSGSRTTRRHNRKACSAG